MLRGAPASTLQRRRRAEVATFTAPIGGWISNRALAIPNADGLQGADRLDNFFPTATGAVLRRGSRPHAQIGNSGASVLSLFKYIVGDNARMFAANETTIYDITTVNYAENISLSLDDEETLIIDEVGSGATTSAPVTAAPAVTSATPATAMPAGADAIRTGLIQRGIPEPVADGFLMNFKDESGLNPSINEAKPLVPGSRGGFGLAQWTGPRRVALEQFAHQSGRPVDDVNTQLDFLVSELKGPEAAAAQSSWVRRRRRMLR